jgi:hypothetical protein
MCAGALNLAGEAALQLALWAWKNREHIGVARDEISGVRGMWNLGRITWLILTCIFLVGCARQGGAVNNIERVLAEDRVASKQATSVADVVARMRAVNASGCPNDFKAAYLAHIHAWETMATVEQEAIAFKSRNDSAGVMVESFIRGFLGDPLGTANEIAAEQSELARDYNVASRQIKATYDRLEEIAVGQGANLVKR